MSGVLVPVSDLFEYSGRPWSEVKFVEVPQSTDADSLNIPKDGTGGGSNQSSQLLPRADYHMYGRYPNLDPKVLLECDKCGMVLLPCVFRAHYENPEHVHATTSTPATSTVNTRAAASSRARRASKQAQVSLASAATTNTYQVTAPATATVTATPSLKFAATSTPVAVTVVASSTTAGKNRKKNKRSRHEVVVVEKESTDVAAIHLPSPPPEPAPVQVKRAKYEPLHLHETLNESTSIPTINIIQIEPEPAKTTTKSSTTTPIASTVTTTSMSMTLKRQIRDDIPSSSYTVTTTVSKQPPMQLLEETHHEEQIEEMPMSPLAVVNILPVKQYLQQYLQLPTQPIVVSIPCSMGDGLIYSSYPKPLTVNTRSLRGCRSTYLPQNSRLYRQRADIQQALNRSRSLLTNSNSTSGSGVLSQNHMSS